jgi:hypothetical protein
MNSQEQGRQLEKRLEKKLSLKRVKGSGNQVFHKLDLEGKTLLISAKWTAEKSYRLSDKDIEEVYDAAKGLGASGLIPIVVTEIDGKQIASLPLDDLISLIKEDAKLLPSDPVDDKYETAKVPGLFRD